MTHHCSCKSKKQKQKRKNPFTSAVRNNSKTDNRATQQNPWTETKSLQLHQCKSQQATSSAIKCHLTSTWSYTLYAHYERKQSVFQLILLVLTWLRA